MPPAGERPAAGSEGGGIAYPLFPCEVLPEVQRQAAPWYFRARECVNSAIISIYRAGATVPAPLFAYNAQEVYKAKKVLDG